MANATLPTKEILIKHKGRIVPVQVDEEDYVFLSRHTWHLTGANERYYASTFFKSTKGGQNIVSMHRMLLGGWASIDHINNDPLDNRKSNLRKADHQQNGWNKGKSKKKTCKSIYKGVRPSPTKENPNRWQAYFKHVEQGAHKSTGKMVYLGYYDTEIDAAKAYNEAIVKYRGEFAWVNDITENYPDKDSVTPTEI